jgi:hypothetical protein
MKSTFVCTYRKREEQDVIVYLALGLGISDSRQLIFLTHSMTRTTVMSSVCLY